VPGLLVSATDTGVGKTILSAALVAAMHTEGVRAIPHKPVLTGLEEQGPADHELLAAAAGMCAEDVAPLRYRPAASPPLAAELSGGPPIDPAELLAGARAAAGEGDVGVVEGVGGLMTPLADGYTVCDFAAQLGLPLLIAARPGLGTINHSLLTVAAARAAGLDVRAVVITPWPHQPSVLERSNRETIARMGTVEVTGLCLARDRSPRELVRIGSRLPWREWLAVAT
jgi:dethiobiotin synthetase